MPGKLTHSFGEVWWGDAEAVLPGEVEPAVVRMAAEAMSAHAGWWLDVGAGDGRIISVTQGWLGGILLLDNMSAACRAAALRIPAGRAAYCTCADGRALPVATGAIDVLSMLDLLSIAADPPALLHEATRVLSENGHLLRTVQNLDDPARVTGRLLEAGPGWERYHTGHYAISFFDAHALEALLASTGFEVEELVEERHQHSRHRFNDTYHEHAYFVFLARPRRK